MNVFEYNQRAIEQNRTKYMRCCKRCSKRRSQKTEISYYAWYLQYIKGYILL